MKSFRKLAERKSALPSVQVIARDGGLPRTTEPTRDPYEWLDDLMAVVDELCPRWPERDIFSDQNLFLL